MNETMKDYIIEGVKLDDAGSICGALFEVSKILDELSEKLETATPSFDGSGIYEISSILENEAQNISEAIDDDD